MTKSKGSMVTRDILYLTIGILLAVVEKENFPLLSIGWLLFGVVTGNRYLPQGSSENTLCITITGNTPTTSWVIPLVAIPVWDFIMIH